MHKGMINTYSKMLMIEPRWWVNVCPLLTVLLTFLYVGNVDNIVLWGKPDQVSRILTGTWKSALALGPSHGALFQQQFFFKCTHSTFTHFLGANSQGRSEIYSATEKEEMVELTSMTFHNRHFHGKTSNTCWWTCLYVPKVVWGRGGGSICLSTVYHMVGVGKICWRVCFLQVCPLCRVISNSYPEGPNTEQPVFFSVIWKPPCVKWGISTWNTGDN